MEDNKIIELFWARDESAIAETEAKYGAYCLRIAMNLLSSGEDARECVNDVFLRLWEMIPPQRPDKLKPLLGKLVRSASIDLWRKNHAQKRYGGIVESLDELSESVPSFRDTERELEDRELSELISRWLYSLPKQERKLFLRRYWHGLSLSELAEESRIPPKKMAQTMYRLRVSLKSYLEKEGHEL